MKKYPITVPRDGYRGSQTRRKSKAAEYNRIASRIENFINNVMENLPKPDCVEIFNSHGIAASIGEPFDLVRDVVYGIDAGANGVTIYKGDYERAMASD